MKVNYISKKLFLYFILIHLLNGGILIHVVDETRLYKQTIKKIKKIIDTNITFWYYKKVVFTTKSQHFKKSVDIKSFGDIIIKLLKN